MLYFKLSSTILFHSFPVYSLFNILSIEDDILDLKVFGKLYNTNILFSFRLFSFSTVVLFSLVRSPSFSLLIFISCYKTLFNKYF